MSHKLNNTVHCVYDYFTKYNVMFQCHQEKPFSLHVLTHVPIPVQVKYLNHATCKCK